MGTSANHFLSATFAAALLVTGACKKDNKVSVTNTSNPCEGADAGPEAVACGGACVDVQTNAAHCGQCDAACPTGGVCTNGTCGCPAGQQVCSGACVDTMTDLKNCGTCSNACATGAECSGGDCACPGVRGAVCMGECADLASDSANCGQCGSACTGGTTCTDSTCACAFGNQKSCGATCIDVSGDELNCGDCGNSCATGASCEEGACQCPGTQGKVCGGACADVATDPEHCGDCSVTCGRLCIGGACPTVASVAAGGSHTCARFSDGSVACWGDNDVGQLGLGDAGSARFAPTVVPGLSDVAHLGAGGRNTCAASTQGELRCWGVNDQHQLTDAAAEFEPSPFLVASYPTGNPPDRLAVGGRFTCAGRRGGDAYCWGANEYSESGATPSLNVGQPTKIANVLDLETLSAGSTYGCAVVRDPGNFGKVMCWGDNRGEVLGVDFATTPTTSVAVPLENPLGNAIAVRAGYTSTCALDAVGQAWCWGSTWITNLPSETRVPEMVAGLPHATHLSGQGDFACARVTGGEIWCWGLSFGGATGQEPPSPVPAAVLDGAGTKLSGMDGVTSGRDHTCAWSATAVWCWGNNEFGQLGNGDGGSGKTSARAVRVVW